MSDTELQEKEQDAVLADTASDFSPEEQSEFEALGANDDQVGEGYTDTGGSKKKGLISGWKKKTGILAIALGTAGFATFGILTKPFEFLQHAQMLKPHLAINDSFGNNRSSKFVVYSLLGKSAQGRLGAVANHNADKWEKRLNEKSGLRSIYSQGTPQRLIGYEVLDEKKARTFLSDLERDGIRTSTDLSGVGIDNKPRTGVLGVKFDRADFDTRRSVVRTALRSIDVNRVSGRLGSRLHIKRGGVNFHLLNRAKKRADISLAEHRKQKQQERDNQNNTGDVDVVDTPGSTLKTKLLKTFNTLKGPTAAVAAICAVKDFSSAVDQQSIENNKMLVRRAMHVVTVASQIQTGQDFTMQDLSELSEGFYDEEKGTSWREDNGLKWENGEEPNGVDDVGDLKPGTDKKPLVFDIADGFNPPGIGVACNTFSAVGDFGPIAAFGNATNDVLKAAGLDIEKYTQMAIDYFSSGVAEAAQGARLGGMTNIGMRLASGDQMRSVAGVAMSDTEGAEVRTESRIDVMALDQTELKDAGFYDKYANAYNPNSLSSKILGNLPSTTDQAVSSFASIPSALNKIGSSLLGGRKASAVTPPEGTYEYTFPLYGFTLADQQDERFENPYENEDQMDSFLSAADAAEQACAARERAAKRKPYPTCENGYSSLRELNTGDSDFSPDDGDGSGDDGSDHQANGRQCFGIEISTSGDLVYGESPDISEVPEACHLQREEIFLRYRFYVADTVTGHTLRCYEGEERSCQQLGFGSSQTSSTSGTSASTDTAAIGNTASTPCAPGTNDAGEVDGWSEGKKYRIRLCEIPGFTSRSGDDRNGVVRVNSTVSHRWLALFNKSQTDKVGLTATSSFRTYATQEYLDNCDRTNLCNNGNEAAAAGYSNHQLGFAVDIDINSAGKDPSLTTCKANPDAYPKYKWLAANAPALGIDAKVSSECWHWSVGGG